ncbi:MAG: hypothetical protein AAF358_13635 [Pseudomonadota bacterium]
MNLTAKTLALCLFALPWIAACGSSQPLVRTETVEVPIEVYAEVPGEFTDPIPYPSPPLPMESGADMAAAFEAYICEARLLIRQANQDRAIVKGLTSGKFVPLLAAAGDLEC